MTMLRSLLLVLMLAAQALAFSVTLAWDPCPPAQLVTSYEVRSGSTTLHVTAVTEVTLTLADVYQGAAVYVVAVSADGTSPPSYSVYLPGAAGLLQMTRIERSFDLAGWSTWDTMPRRTPQTIRIVFKDGSVIVEQSNDGGATWEYVLNLPAAPRQFLRLANP